MARWKWLAVSLLTVGCSSPSGRSGSPQPEPVYYEGNTSGCAAIEQVCLQTEPPQCFDYCADEGPKKGGTCEGSGDVQTCGDSQCVVGEDEGGKSVQVCVGMDCAISYDATTKQETIYCGASDAGVSDAPGTADGSAGID